jgi:sugar transferase (PEP-CTERM/EpsH1 system associated)
MKLLFLTPQLPYPPHQGTTIRNLHLLAGLAKRHDVTLLSFCEPGQSPAADTPLPTLCTAVHTVLAPPTRSLWERLRTTLLSAQPDMALRLASDAFQTTLERLLHDRSFDVLQVEGIELGRYALSLRRRRQLPAATALVFDDHNAEYVLQQRAFVTDLRQPRRWPAAAYSLIQWRKLCRFESAVCRSADAVVTVSDADARAIRRLVPSVASTVVPNGVDVDYFRPDAVHGDEPERPMVVFTGKMDFRPNVDAVVWFCDEVLPRLQATRSDVEFFIVGREPHRRVQALAAHPGVTITGFVDDVRPYIADAAVYVVPLRMGGGTRLKVLQAMAMAKPIVSTRIGAEGITAQPDEHLVVANHAAEFAQVTLDLLADPQRRAALGARARELAVGQYAWSRIVPRMEAVYTQLPPHS